MSAAAGETLLEHESKLLLAGFGVPLAREHEEQLYTHLGRAKYWEREPRASEGKGYGKS